ncbi:hypothetical protein QQE94_09635 [Fervidobacterium pennivorans subsp. shakshaketiis]|uniref:Uncharacterized protein n=1 Tax=Fervidobacterium pennivorans (strain DSM 9078 / Ven5) TaxID=771875 RepID=H9UF03_FERPD|nr:hypothetical protein [Fervidobacterium pennivorans]AFG36096.1 hypothetical protein Ferpe_2049 [Fervidobacterium pennivorans DSM 9078]QIV79134.1 hypothetical protein HER11_09590 [Fervidobacterium pennivorans subsp. keratinolyticus]
MFKRLFISCFLVIITLAYAYFNIGVGYNYGEFSNWVLRVGYEDYGFNLNADWTLNKLWNIYAGVSFETALGFLVGPAIYATYDYNASSNAFSVVYGPVLGFSNKQLFVQVGYFSDFATFVDVSDALFASLRFYVPDPPGMKMVDKLYIEAQYYRGSFKICVGLLEPYF